MNKIFMALGIGQHSTAQQEEAIREKDARIVLQFHPRTVEIVPGILYGRANLVVPNCLRPPETFRIEQIRVMFSDGMCEKDIRACRNAYWGTFQLGQKIYYQAPLAAFDLPGRQVPPPEVEFSHDALECPGARQIDIESLMRFEFTLETINPPAVGLFDVMVCFHGLHSYGLQ